MTPKFVCNAFRLLFRALRRPKPLLAGSLTLLWLLVGAAGQLADADTKKGVGDPAVASGAPYAFLAPTKAKRGRDAAGCGGFQCPREGRAHQSIDYLVDPGQPVPAPINGVVSRIGKVFAHSDLQYVEITTSDGAVRCRSLYLTPTVKLHTIVVIGDLIGVAGDVRLAYRGVVGMEPHLHEDCRLADGTRIDFEHDPRFKYQTREK